MALSVETTSTASTASLFELVQAVAGARNLDDIYDAALHSLQQGLGVERSAILLFDNAGIMRFCASHGLSPGYLAALEGHSPWPLDIADAKAVLVPDVREAPSLKELRPAMEAEGIGALAFIPLSIGGRLLGKFTLNYPAPHDFSDAELMLARTLAAQVAFAIEQRRGSDERQYLDAVVRSNVAGIAEIDREGRFQAANDRFCAIVGRERVDLLGLDFAAIAHPGDREAVRMSLEGLLSDARDFVLEFRYVRPSGAVVWVSGSVSALQGPDGEVRGAVGIVTDTTERMTAEELLLESESRYRTLVESLGLGVYTTDADGYLVVYNQAAADLWGRQPDIGKDQWCGSWKLYHGGGEPMRHSECPMARTLEEGEPVRDVEILAERPDGGRVRLLPYPSPIRDAAGVLVGGVNVLVDITELHRTQEALELAIRGKDDFLGQVSHELRNPVTQVVGNTEVLLNRWRTLPDGTHEESLEQIHTAALRLQRLVDNMMMLSRFERGVLPEAEPQLIQRLLKETLREFRQRFPATSVEVSIEPGLPPVEIRSSTIDQVIWNLLTNARKYGPPGGPVEIELRRAGEFVELLVRDCGEGVPEDEMDRLFEPYFRSSNTPEVAAGLGLGLSVCKRLIEAHDGEMWANRRDGAGMEFGLRLEAIAEAR